jgi:murein DD-endopeptidase MepM/ murein hydrolase activator NlpD
VDAQNATFRYSSPRWFKVTVAGARPGFVHSSLVDNQTTVPSCIGLPFAVGEKWTTSGTHPWNGYSGNRGHVDFSGSSGIVRAAGPGTIHITSCGLVMIHHGAGRYTSYYHINIDPSVVHGRQVTTGAVLGTIGTRTNCGGSSDGAHVHYGIWQVPAGANLDRLEPSWNVTMNGMDIGGWIVKDHPNNYWASFARVPSGEVQYSHEGYALLTNDGRLA